MITRLLLADDHQMFLDGLSAMLKDEEGLSIVHQVLDGTEVIVALRETPVDIAIIDISMPRMNGIETIYKIREEFPEVKILLLSMHNDRKNIKDAVEAKTDGYLLKNAGKLEFLQAIELLKKGRSYYSPGVTDVILKGLEDPTRKKAEHLSLSARELEVLQLIAKEMTNEEIAAAIFLSVHTIKSHRKSLLSKLNVKNTVGLVLYAERNDLLDE
jgi:DNA-binding NarL/FixJ family response regulator